MRRIKSVYLYLWGNIMEVKQLTNLIVNMPNQQPNPIIANSQNPTPNPYNSRSDGFLLKNILGASAGMSMKPIVFDGAPPKVPSFGDGHGGLYTPPTDSLAGKVVPSALVQTATNIGGISILYGVASLAKQLNGMNKGQQDGKGATANVITDMMRGGAIAIGGSAGGGLAAVAVKAMGATGGVMGIISSCIGGLVGTTIASSLFENSGIREGMVKKFGSVKA